MEPPSPFVEIGWVLAGRVDPLDVAAVRTARAQVLDVLQDAFPGYRWQMPLVQRREVDTAGRAEPARLIDHGAQEREAMQWDFAFVVTDVDLQSYYKPFAFGTPSRAVGTAVLSTARLDPATRSTVVSEHRRTDVIARRVVALALHLFGHLNALPHSQDAGDFMYDLQTVDDLDGMAHYSEAAHNQLRAELADVADLRLEETGRFRGPALRFAAHAVWQNRMDVLRAVVGIRPWQFPFRLSRLTTAAVSTMLILVITAEAWDLGMSQPPLLVAGLSLAALLGTSYYILTRQALLVRRGTRRPNEQRVVGNVAVATAVLLGMGTTYALLFLATLVLGLTLFNRVLVEEWAASLAGNITFGNYLVLAGFVASLGILIGALGTSFEGRGYFRHVAYVDEET